MKKKYITLLASCILQLLSLCHWNLCDYVGACIMQFAQPQPRKGDVPRQEMHQGHFAPEVQRNTHMLGHGSSSISLSILPQPPSTQMIRDRRAPCISHPLTAHFFLKGAKKPYFPCPPINRPHCCQTPNLWAPCAYARVHTLIVSLLLFTQDPC